MDGLSGLCILMLKEMEGLCMCYLRQHAFMKSARSLVSPKKSKRRQGCEKASSDDG